ncbi:gamma-gliadin-like, partial [Triticum dicoccoides]|uniref:gamma-gliadin-like n=1 Tax=Triticum dicoccoides TaxID=85692 RepID=UPI00188F501E
PPPIYRSTLVAKYNGRNNNHSPSPNHSPSNHNKRFPNPNKHPPFNHNKYFPNHNNHNNNFPSPGNHNNHFPSPNNPNYHFPNNPNNHSPSLINPNNHFPSHNKPQQPFPQPQQQFPQPQQKQQSFPQQQQPLIQPYLQQQMNPCKNYLLQQCNPVSLVSSLVSMILPRSDCQVMQQQCCQQLAQIPRQLQCTAIHSVVHAIIMEQEQQGIQILRPLFQLVQGQGIIQPQQPAQYEVIRSLVLRTLPNMCNMYVRPDCSTINAPFASIVAGIGGQ